MRRSIVEMIKRKTPERKKINGRLETGSRVKVPTCSLFGNVSINTLPTTVPMAHPMPFTMLATATAFPRSVGCTASKT